MNKEPFHKWHPRYLELRQQYKNAHRNAIRAINVTMDPQLTYKQWLVAREMKSAACRRADELMQKLKEFAQ